MVHCISHIYDMTDFKETIQQLNDSSNTNIIDNWKLRSI